ncbi:MAG: ABC transporter permease [Azospirillaceae bacterium]
MGWLRSRWKSLVFFLCLIVLWQVAVDTGFLLRFIVPSPTDVLGEIAGRWDRLLMHLGYTLMIALAIGVTMAVLIAHSRFLAESLYPILVLSQVVPTIAIAPLLSIWFGPGEVTKLIVVFLITVFPIVVNTTAGLLQVDDDLLYVVKGLKASRWKIFVLIRMPNALPSLFAAMRISITLAVIGAVVAEFVAGSIGLGYVVFTGAANVNTRLVFAAVVILGAMGIALFTAVKLLQRVALPWAQGTKEGEA